MSVITATEIEAAIRREVQEALAKELATGAAGERSEPAEPASPKGADA